MRTLKHTLIMLSLLGLTGTANAWSKDMSWGEITSDFSLKANSGSVKNPEGTNLFNVCVYSEDTFKVINPQPKCIETKTVTVGANRKDSYTVKKCAAYAPVEETFVPSSYVPCMKRSYVWSDGPRKDAYVVSSECIEFGDETPIPTTQMVDVYKDAKEYFFVFKKEFTVPDCSDVSPVPGKDK